MKIRSRMVVTGSLVGLGLLFGWSSAAGAADPTPAETEAEELNAAAREVDQTSAPESARSEAVARQFNVDSSVVQGMRNRGQGWGEITIQLAMAEHLANTEPATYPTSADARTRVEELRREGKGWGAIAKELGFKLGPVISDVKQTHQRVQTESRRDQPKMEKTDRPSKVERPSKTERPPKMERFDRPERPVRPEHREHPIRSTQ